MSYNYNNGEVLAVRIWQAFLKNCHYCHCFDIYNSLIKITAPILQGRKLSHNLNNLLTVANQWQNQDLDAKVWSQVHSINHCLMDDERCFRKYQQSVLLTPIFYGKTSYQCVMRLKLFPGYIIIVIIEMNSYYVLKLLHTKQMVIYL